MKLRNCGRFRTIATSRAARNAEIVTAFGIFDYVISFYLEVVVTNQ
jgi:hypothetical protein